MDWGKMSRVLRALRVLEIDGNMVSPTYINDFANKIGVELTSEEVNQISNDY